MAERATSNGLRVVAFAGSLRRGSRLLKRFARWIERERGGRSRAGARVTVAGASSRGDVSHLY